MSPSTVGWGIMARPRRRAPCFPSRQHPLVRQRRPVAARQGAVARAPLARRAKLVAKARLRKERAPRSSLRPRRRPLPRQSPLRRLVPSMRRRRTPSRDQRSGGRRTRRQSRSAARPRLACRILRANDLRSYSLKSTDTWRRSSAAPKGTMASHLSRAPPSISGQCKISFGTSRPMGQSPRTKVTGRITLRVTRRGVRDLRRGARRQLTRTDASFTCNLCTPSGTLTCKFQRN
mmetsp:Transcript_107647/g.303205  ORF Transcript_107647/g.303205 Transcript_107647/m.303205 type:complete len:233 (-) Transcript_107647:1930-2628(-)